MYQCVLLKSLLFNSQSWSNITQTHMKDLQTIQLKFLKRMMQAPNSTPNCFVFLELGLLPIQYEIHKCQLSFLHHVLHLQPTKPVSQIYHQQLNFSHEPNWGNSVENLLKTYDLCITDIQHMTKDEWKLVANNAIESHAFLSLKSEALLKIKTSHLTYESFKPQPYLFTCVPRVASFLFRLRSKSLNCRNNHHSSNPNLTCRHCNTSIESQQHIINCRTVFPKQSHLIVDEFNVAVLQPKNSMFTQRVIDRYKSFHEWKPTNQQWTPSLCTAVCQWYGLNKHSFFICYSQGGRIPRSVGSGAPTK